MIILKFLSNHQKRKKEVVLLLTSQNVVLINLGSLLKIEQMPKKDEQKSTCSACCLIFNLVDARSAIE